MSARLRAAIGPEKLLRDNQAPGTHDGRPELGGHGSWTDGRGEDIRGAAVARFLDLAAPCLALQQDDRNCGIERAVAAADSWHETDLGFSIQGAEDRVEMLRVQPFSRERVRLQPTNFTRDDW